VIVQRWVIALSLIAVLSAAVLAQDRLRTMPGYEQYQRMAREIPSAVRSGALAATWTDGGKSVEYTREDKRYRFDLASRQTIDLGTPDAGQTGRGQPRQLPQGRPERGRQFDSAMSPDGRMKAFYRDRNLWLSAADGTNESAITIDGSLATRVKYGTASWVYGEELDQQTAMWWSPDSRKIAYYRFDEKQVPDYYVALDQTGLQDTIDAEAYPKSGMPNPIVDLFVYDVSTRHSTKIDVRDGKPFDDAVIGHYVYRVG
jgi:dipeptidyl-peptidase-4